MDIYFTLFFLVLLINIFSLPNSSKYDIKLILSFCLIFIYAASRVNLGADYPGYKYFFEIINKSSEIDKGIRLEKGYQWLNIVLPSFRILLITTSLLFCMAYYYLFTKYIAAKDRIIAFCIFFLCLYTFLIQLSGIRNSIAVSFFILSSFFLKERKIFWFIAIMFIASLFHNSALMLIPLYFFITPNYLTSKRIKILISVAIIYTFSSNLFLSDYVEIIIDSLFPNYMVYLLDIKSIIFVWTLPAVLHRLIVLFLLSITLFSLRNSDLSKKYLIVIKLMAFYYVIRLTPSIGLTSRFFFYFSPFLVAGFPIIFRMLKNQIFKYSFLTLQIGLLIYELYVFFKSEQLIYYYKYESTIINFLF